MPTETPPPPPGFTLDAPPAASAGPAPPPPPGFTLDKPPTATAPPSAAAPAVQPSGDYDIPTQVTRAAAKGAISVIDFIPDMLTYAYNASPLVDQKSKLKLPSSYLNRRLDEMLTPPQTSSEKFGEESSSALISGAASGGASLVRSGAQIVKKSAEVATKQLSRVATRAAEEAHVAGYKLPPSYIGGDVRKSMQSMVGGPKVEKEFAKENAVVTDNLAKLSLGLHPEQELSEETFQALREDAYKPYEKVRALGKLPSDGQYIKDVMGAGGRFADRGESFGGSRFPEIAAEKQPYYQEEFDASHALDEIRMLRKLSRDNLKQYNPTSNALGMTQREIANALENRIDRYATEIGQGDLVKELREARTQIAKITAVEDSIGAGGHVRADDLKRMLDRGMPLTDSLKTIAETAKHFPKAVQELTQGEAGSFSTVDYLLGGSGIMSGNPAVALPIVGRPLTRWALKTEGAQKAMISDLRKTPSKARQAASAVAGELGKTLKAGARAGTRGAGILGTEELEEYVNGPSELEQLTR